MLIEPVMIPGGKPIRFALNIATSPSIRVEPVFTVSLKDSVVNPVVRYKKGGQGVGRTEGDTEEEEEGERREEGESEEEEESEGGGESEGVEENEGLGDKDLVGDRELLPVPELEMLVVALWLMDVEGVVDPVMDGLMLGVCDVDID